MLADGTTIALPPGTTATVTAAATTVIANASNAATVATITNGTIVVEKNNATVAANVTESEDETTAAADVTLENSTIASDGNGTDVLTSAKPGNGHGGDDDEASNATISDVEVTTGADSASNDTVDVEATTIDANITTIASNGTELVDTTINPSGEDGTNATTIGIICLVQPSNRMVYARSSQSNETPSFPSSSSSCLLVCFMHASKFLSAESSSTNNELIVALFFQKHPTRMVS